ALLAERVIFALDAVRGLLDLDVPRLIVDKLPIAHDREPTIDVTLINAEHSFSLRCQRSLPKDILHSDLDQPISMDGHTLCIWVGSADMNVGITFDPIVTNDDLGPRYSRTTKLILQLNPKLSFLFWG